MVRNSQIVSVSISKEQSDFIESVGLSASSLLQEAIDSQMLASAQLRKERDVLQDRIRGYQLLLEKAFAFLDFKNIDQAEFNNWKFEQSKINGIN